VGRINTVSMRQLIRPSICAFGVSESAVSPHQGNDQRAPPLSPQWWDLPAQARRWPWWQLAAWYAPFC